MLRCAARRRRRRAFSDSATRRQDTAASMAYQFSRKGCFKCGNRKFSASNLDCASGAQIPTSPVGHIAENCSSEQRLCYNCRQPGHESSACPSPRTVASKQCYSCGGVGHIQGMFPLPRSAHRADCIRAAECPTLRLQQQGSNSKCYVRPISPRRNVHSYCYRIVVALDTSLATARAPLPGASPLARRPRAAV